MFKNLLNKNTHTPFGKEIEFWQTPITQTKFLEGALQ